MIHIKTLNLHVALSALPLAVVSAIATGAEPQPANADVSPGFTKYDAAGNELPSDATNWHYHWQHDTNIEWLNCNLGDKQWQHAAAEKRLEEIGDGWNIPSDKQWESEIDRTKFKPALRNPDLFPGIKSDLYWTSTRAPSDPEYYAFYVHLYGGYVYLYGRHGAAWVRPCRVRRAPSQ